MKNFLIFLSNPLKVIVSVYLVSLITLSKNFEFDSNFNPLINILVILIFISVLWIVPFIIMSILTKYQIRNPKNYIRLTVMWVLSISASLIWISSIIFSSNEQAGLGYMFVGAIALGAAIAGYILGWLISIFNKK